MYYFAYGSNMNLEHMRRLCGWHFSVLGAAKLSGFEYGSDNRGFANIYKKDGAHVYGVLYELDQHSLDILDEFEGSPEVFRRIELEVEDLAGQKVKVWVYKENSDQFHGRHINENYLRRAVAGAVENKLPKEWVEFLESLREE